MRFQVKPPDPLIVQVAEVQRSIRSDHETVRIVDGPIGVPGEPVPITVDTVGVAALARAELSTMNSALRTSRRFT